jgi:hypothetical protein
MSNNLTIRPVALTNFDQWLPLWNGYNAFYGGSGAILSASRLAGAPVAVALTPEPLH